MTANSIQTGVENRQAKALMVFILVLSLSGLENLIAEIIPTFELGPIEIGISNFWFVPLALVIIFDSWWAALAAPIGELIFSDLVLGEFGGLGEFEEVVLTTFALFISAWLVRDVKNFRVLAIVVFISYLIQEIPATFIDIFKVVIGVEEFEAVEGLPQSIYVIEGIDLLIEYIVSGVIFGALPALWLVPRLYGRIEPLMGMKPRTPEDRKNAQSPTVLWVIGIAGVVLATIIATVSEMGFNIVEWEPEFLESVGGWFIWVGIVAAALVAGGVLIFRWQASRNEKPAGGSN